MFKKMIKYLVSLSMVLTILVSFTPVLADDLQDDSNSILIRKSSIFANKLTDVLSENQQKELKKIVSEEDSEVIAFDDNYTLYRQYDEGVSPFKSDQSSPHKQYLVLNVRFSDSSENDLKIPLDALSSDFSKALIGGNNKEVDSNHSEYMPILYLGVVIVTIALSVVIQRIYS